jgi:hypothetical protein
MIVFLTYSSQTKNFLLGNMPSVVCASNSLVVPSPPVVLAFNCIGPVAEEHYLRSDMSVLCYKGDHVSAMVLSAILGVLWAFAAPAAVKVFAILF